MQLRDPTASQPRAPPPCLDDTRVDSVRDAVAVASDRPQPMYERRSVAVLSRVVEGGSRGTQSGHAGRRTASIVLCPKRRSGYPRSLEAATMADPGRSPRRAKPTLVAGRCGPFRRIVGSGTSRIVDDFADGPSQLGDIHAACPSGSARCSPVITPSRTSSVGHRVGNESAFSSARFRRGRLVPASRRYPFKDGMLFVS